ncbi:hypothetical protein Taro_039287 [Colocasia esculenta]|uniref:Uncharacterized protein n=1 Tax=Colocasia esculenta TaxID=4460 RepID=A0A843WPR3_COLES|nr:hypothetical protein [Colocasia esculenta]
MAERQPVRTSRDVTSGRSSRPRHRQVLYFPHRHLWTMDYSCKVWCKPCRRRLIPRQHSRLSWRLSPRAPARVFALAREDAEQAEHVTEGHSQAFGPPVLPSSLSHLLSKPFSALPLSLSWLLRANFLPLVVVPLPTKLAEAPGLLLSAGPSIVMIDCPRLSFPKVRPRLNYTLKRTGTTRSDVKIAIAS